MQTDHQEQCAEMARRWGNDRFDRLSHWDDVVLAAALHDEGWRSWEADPLPGPDGRPVDFPDVDRETHVALYREGIATVAQRSVRAGLLVSMHGSGLYERRFGLGGSAPARSGQPPSVRAFLDEQERWRAEMVTELGEGTRAWVWDAYRLLQAWDGLSLYLIWRALPAGRPGELTAVPRFAGDEGVTIAIAADGARGCRVDPWPFAGKEAPLPVRARPWSGGDVRGRSSRMETYVARSADAG